MAKRLQHGSRKGKSGRTPKYKIKLLKNLAHALLAELDEFDKVGISRGVRVDDPRAIDLRNELRTYEIGLIEWSLRRTAGNQTKAARLLGLKPTTLHSKLRLYGISPGHTFGNSRSRAAPLRKSVSPEPKIAGDHQSP